jgi:exodeoxyribonuclease VII large subunit
MLPADNVKVLTVGEATRALKCLVEDAFPALWITGEITSFKKHSSGHLYLTLKDAEAQLKAVIWRSTAIRIRHELRDGIEVIVRGRLDVYAPYGEYKLIIDEIQPKGLGAQEIALRKLKEKLQRLGYFEPARKRQLPRFPRRVGIITSPTGAAVRDIIKILRRRWPAIEVWIFPVKVQGDGAGQEIAWALHALNRLHQAGAHRLDVLIVGRGGGAQEDLSAFNDERVAQAIFVSKIPVISAVGHEIDLTIADLVADRRAATPSEAAEYAAPDQQELIQYLQSLDNRLSDLLRRRLKQSRQSFEDLAARRPFRFPLERIRDIDQRLDGWFDRLGRAALQKMTQARQLLGAQVAQLESLSPLNVLARGYSLTRRETDSSVIRSPEQVKPGDRIVTRVRDGSFVSRVES